MKKTWIYYGVFFSDKTKRAILDYAKYWIYKKFNNNIPDNWKIYCDHVTLVFNDGTPKAQEAADFYENHMLNQYISMHITHIGISNKSIAFQVDCETENKHSHITVAIAPDAKPVDSNNIENWYELDEKDWYYVSGKINKVIPSKK